MALGVVVVVAVVKGRKGKSWRRLRGSVEGLFLRDVPKGMPYSEATWLSSELVLNKPRLGDEVPGVAGAANALMAHWRQQSRKVRNLGIMFVQSSSQETNPTRTSSCSIYRTPRHAIGVVSSRIRDNNGSKR